MTQNVIKYFVTFLGLILIFFIIYIPFILIGSSINGIHKYFKNKLSNELSVEKVDIDNLDFSRISIDVNFNNIIINEGSFFSVKTNNDNIKFEVDDDTLYIKEKGIKSNDYKLYLNIPLELINILDINMFKGNINIDNVKVSELNIDVKYGDIVINNSVFNDIDSELGIGNFNFDGKINDMIYVDSGIGNVTIMVNDSVDNYKVDTTNIIGSILIDGKNKLNVNNGDKIINVKNKMGAISINF